MDNVPVTLKGCDRPVIGLPCFNEGECKGCVYEELSEGNARRKLKHSFGEEQKYINKQDNGKPRWELVPMQALEGIARVMADAIKPGPNGEVPRYKEHSWQSVEPKRYFAALLRHVADLQAGQFLTEDTKMETIDAILTNAMFLSWFRKNGIDLGLEIKFEKPFNLSKFARRLFVPATCGQETCNED